MGMDRERRAVVPGRKGVPVAKAETEDHSRGQLEEQQRIRGGNISRLLRGERGEGLQEYEFSMCEGYRKLIRIPLALAFLFAAASSAFAQDGTGRSESVAWPAGPAPKHRVARRAPVRDSTPPPIKRVELGKIALTVNEGGSRVEIARLDAPATPEVVPVPSRASSLIIRTLVAGNYRISVTKPGYQAETRDFWVADGKRHRLAVYLKPTMAILTVAASIPDARIEIETVGSYSKPVDRLLLKPGRYRISVSRRGYVPQKVSVDLKAAGREQNVNVVLKPLRIDELLEDANESLAKGNYETARGLAGDVLLFNAAHARANLLYGRVEQRSGQDATPYFLRAIRSGETYRVPVRVQDPRGAGLLDAELSVERGGISLKSPGRVDLDLTIPKGNITALN